MQQCVRNVGGAARTCQLRSVWFGFRFSQKVLLVFRFGLSKNFHVVSVWLSSTRIVIYVPLLSGTQGRLCVATAQRAA